MMTLAVFMSWDIGQYMYYNYFLPVCDVMHAEMNLSFEINQTTFLHGQKSREKNLNIFRTKVAF